MSDRLWRRVRQGLAQYVKQRGIDPKRVSRVAHALHELKRFCGNASHSRKALYHLGCALLEDHPYILVPVCPDYSNLNGRFTFEGLGDGVPLLVKLHARFLKRVKKWLPRVRVIFLIADQEARVHELRAILGVTEAEFRTRTRQSIKAATAFLKGTGWRVVPMSQYVQGFHRLKAERASALLADETLRSHLTALALSRASFYQRIGYPEDVWFSRTIQNAAEYLVLAEFAKARHAIVCNHTTANLNWYASVGTALLHNPIHVY